MKKLYQNTTLNKILILMMICVGFLNAYDKNHIENVTKNIAYISAPSLYEVDYKSLELSLNKILNKHKRIMAVTIIDSLSKKEIYHSYRKEDKMISDDFIPKEFKQYNFLRYDSVFNEEIVGEIIVYYTNDFLSVLSKEEKEYLINKKELTICVKQDMLPYEDFKDGEFIGISSDFLNLYSEKLSIPLRIIPSTNQVESLELLKNGKCDIKPIIGVDAKTKIPYIHSDGFLGDSIALITRIEQPFIQNLHNIDQTILIAGGFNRFIKYINKEYPNLKVKQVPDVNTALELVASGEEFGYIGVSLISSYYIQKKFSSKLKVINDFKHFDFGVGVLKSEPILLEIINKAIRTTSSPEKKLIVDKWIAATVEKETDYTLIWEILIAAILVILFFIYRQYETKQLNIKLQLKIDEELKKSFEQNQRMMQQSRLAQMGEMISMIAHQWRQPLNSISLTSNNLQFKLLMDDIDKDLFIQEVQLIDEYSQHLSKTIDDFRGFFKESKIKEPITLDEIVKSTLTIIQASVESKYIKIVTVLNADKEIETYPGEIKQVLLNIIKNAEDILVENRIDYCIKEPTITIETKSFSDKQVIYIKDNAGGVPSDVLPNIFNPYFSTKLEKDGTGLGLYMSKTIIEDHCGGKLKVLNDDDGAVFMIELN